MFHSFGSIKVEQTAVEGEGHKTEGEGIYKNQTKGKVPLRYLK